MASVGLLTATALGGIGTAVVAKQAGDKLEKITRPRSISSVPQPKPIEPTPELAAPTLADAGEEDAVKEQRKIRKRQRGRASTIFGGALGDDSLQGSTAKVTLGV